MVERVEVEVQWDGLCAILQDLSMRPGTTFSTLRSDGTRRTSSYNEAVHSNGLQQLVIELAVPPPRH